MRDSMLSIGMRLIYLGICDMRNRGVEVISKSTICRGLPPADGSSFEFLVARSHEIFFPPSHACFSG